ncbi:MAG: HD domain-containing protein [Parcubacteria group bacterium]|nr:HD domain-containing protein [Parcubacteria group bacterium]
MAKEFEVPKEVLDVVTTLQNKGFEAYLVGGCTRDLFLGKKPKDWDVTTNATPDEIQGLFLHTFYENEYGTVGVVNDDATDETLKVVEVTPYRIEEKYSDKRRPDAVSFSKKLEDDLKRRDFTVNAIAYDPVNHTIFDFFRGEQDLQDRVIRAVGKPEERFDEDALRMMRAVRLAAQLGFSIETDTGDAIRKLSATIEMIAKERVQDEFSHLLMSSSPMHGIKLLHEHGLLKYIAPELEEGIGVEQNGDHIYDVWEHNLRAVQHSAEREWPLHVRLAALFHDVAKPETRQWSDEKKDWTFYGHDVVGGRKAKGVMQRLKYSGEITETVAKLVRWHLFFSDIDQITLSAVRRLVRNVGPENVWDLMKVRACDRIGMGRPKEKPYRLRKYESMIEEATRAPVTVGMLNIDGETIMEETGEKPGPRIGWILHALLEEVLDDPAHNTNKRLLAQARALAKLADEALQKLGEAGKEKRLEEEEKEISEIRKRHGVK